GFSTTPNFAESMVSRTTSGRCDIASAMRGLLCFLNFVGKQHVVNLLFQRLRVLAFCPSARKAVHLGLDLSRMRRQEQDAVAYLDNLPLEVSANVTFCLTVFHGSS